MAKKGYELSKERTESQRGYDDPYEHAYSAAEDFCRTVEGLQGSDVDIWSKTYDVVETFSGRLIKCLMKLHAEDRLSATEACFRGLLRLAADWPTLHAALYPGSPPKPTTKIFGIVGLESARCNASPGPSIDDEARELCSSQNGRGALLIRAALRPAQMHTKKKHNAPTSNRIMAFSDPRKSVPDVEVLVRYSRAKKCTELEWRQIGSGCSGPLTDIWMDKTASLRLGVALRRARQARLKDAQDQARRPTARQGTCVSCMTP